MPNYATSVADLQRQIQEAIDRLALELKRIDEKIAPVVERAENSHPDDGLFKANLELKTSYIELGKQAVIIQALLTYQQLAFALLDLEVRRAQAEADAAAAEAASEKAQHAAEKKAKQEEADAQAKAEAEKAKAEADKTKADNDVKAAQAKADADVAVAKAKADGDVVAAKVKADTDKAAADAAKAKADADVAAAKAKADAERDAAQKDFDSDQKANAAKKQAALKKAEQDAIKAMIEALNAAATAFKGSASTILEIKKMKDDLEKEIKTGRSVVDGPSS
ncbi:MAG: hypothetical protein HYS06_06140 [Methylocystis sp.]|nr:hypothetical protein [Methylocystis sp.]